MTVRLAAASAILALIVAFVGHPSAQADEPSTCSPPAPGRFCPDTPAGQSSSYAQWLIQSTSVADATPLLGLDHLRREAWDAQSPDIDRMEPHRIRQLTVHHAGVHGEPPGPEQFRIWESWHRIRGWGDLAYHVIVGLDGEVYEARDPAFAGDTGTNYDPNGHFLVVLEGNLDETPPTEAQVDALVAVLAWASTTFDVSPETITGHRDHAATLCPGRHVYELIRSGVLEQAVVDELERSGL